MKKQIRFIVILIFMCILFISAGPPVKAEVTTLTFYQAKLSHVLQSLSKITGIKMITNAELGERLISAYLENVSGEAAIDSILNANGLYREKMTGTEIYIVRESMPVDKPSLKSETFFLQYAKAEDMGKMLTPLVGEGGQVAVDKRTNSVTLRDNPEGLKELGAVIKSLDKVVSQVAIEAVLVELTTDSLKDLGINWNLAASAFGPALDTSFPWSESYTREIVGPRRGEQTSETQGPQFTLGTISLQELTASLRILESKGEANILANPRITTLNDSPAEIKITKEMAVSPERRLEDIDTARGVSDYVYEYKYKDVGIILNVTPHINAEGYITLDVEPTVSSPSASAIFPDAIDINKRTAKTKVMVKNGETLVIGGLLSKNTEETKSKVPILGDILPFLFSRTDKRTDKTDLVMFLTPKIITDKQASVIAQEEKKRMGTE
jgi:type IV pilus assembly protein PilQ